jgi:hypothetical protein
MITGSISQEEPMLTIKRQSVTLYVDRPSQQWVARDSDGDYWVIPAVDEPWNHRQPFTPSDESVLEPVPGHYKYMLGLPF